MKTILWKEFRQTARYAPLGLVMLSFAVWEIQRSSRLVLDANHRLPMYVLAVGSAFALALGFFQFRGDRAPAARALLVHRCTSVSTIFWGKFLAGAVMYLGAMLPPLLYLMARLALDSRETIATYPSALFPSLFTMVAGFTFWPVSCLLIHRPNRIWGGRLLPLVACGLAMAGLNIMLSETDNVITWSLLGVVPLAVATYLARTAFENRSDLPSPARFSHWVINTFAVLVIFIALAGTLFDSTYVGKRYHLTFGEDARPWLVEQSIRNGPSELRGVPLSPDHPVKDEGDFRSGVPSAEFFQLAVARRLDHHRHITLLHTYQDSDPSPAQVDVLLDDKAGEILVYRNDGFGYELQRQIRPESGRLGKYVSHSSVAHAPIYHHSYAWVAVPNAPTLLACDNGVFILDAKAESVQPLLALPPSAEVGRIAVVSHGNRTDSIEYGLRVDEKAILIRADSLPPRDQGTDGTEVNAGQNDPNGPATVAPARIADAPASPGLEVGGALSPAPTTALSLDVPASPGSASGGIRLPKIDLESIRLQEVPLPAAVQDYDNIFFARVPGTNDEFSCFAHRSAGRMELMDVPSVRFNAAGEASERTVYREYIGMEGQGASGWSAAAFIPTGVFAMIMGLDAMLSQHPEVARRAWAELQSHPSHLIWLLITAGLGIGLAVWVARRRGLSRSATLWCCIGGAFFGPLAALVCLTLYPRINRQPCVACGSPTRVTQSECEHCGIDSAELPRRGIEIFDDASPTTEGALRVSSST